MQEVLVSKLSHCVKIPEIPIVIWNFAPSIKTLVISFTISKGIGILVETIINKPRGAAVVDSSHQSN